MMNVSIRLAGLCGVCAGGRVGAKVCGFAANRHAGGVPPPTESGASPPPNLPLPQTESGTSSEVPPYNAELTEKLCAHKTFAEGNIVALINVSLIHINIVYNVYDS